MACKHRWSEEVIVDVLLWTQTNSFNPVGCRRFPSAGSENRAGWRVVVGALVRAAPKATGGQQKRKLAETHVIWSRSASWSRRNAFKDTVSRRRVVQVADVIKRLCVCIDALWRWRRGKLASPLQMGLAQEHRAKVRQLNTVGKAPRQYAFARTCCHRND